MSNAEYQKRLQMSVPELFTELGAELQGGHAAQPDKDEQEKLGQRYFERERPRIRERLCVSEVMKSLSSESDEVKMAAAIGDLLAPAFGMLPIFTLSMLVTKIGINKLCPPESK